MAASDGPVVIGIGEILWDVFPEGPRFGGAPANFACHAAALLSKSWMISAVGDDELGREAVQRLKTAGVETSRVQILPRFPTGTVKVKLDERGTAEYRFGDEDAWDHLAWTDEAASLCQTADAICFGSLGQRHAVAKNSIQLAVENAPRSAWRLFDINLRSPYYSWEVIDESLQLANALKLNDDELEWLGGQLDLPRGERQRMQALADRFQLKLVALSRGAAGAVLWREGDWSEHDGFETQVVDTVGAGDSYTATLIAGLLFEQDLATINRLACQVAAFVCGQAGATPTVPSELVQQLRR